MNRADLTAHIANSASLPKGTADKALDAVFDAISAALGRGEEGVRLNKRHKSSTGFSITHCSAYDFTGF